MDIDNPDVTIGHEAKRFSKVARIRSSI